MGVYIFLDIMPNHISKEAWERVYNESLKLIDAYPFMDKIVDMETYDAPWVYVDRAKEREITNVLGKYKIGWHVFGDLKSMMAAESVALMQNLKLYRHNDSDGGYNDILAKEVFREIASNIVEYESEKFGHVRVFDGKTQGYPHHIYLLAIACLIESRFPKHALVYGDISIGQIKRAVIWANTILENPIDVTERMNNNKLLKRIKSIIDDEVDVLDAFIGLTFSDKSFQLGEFMRNHFSPEVITAYYTERFSKHNPEQIGFRDDLRDFFNLGFPLEDACDICVLNPEGCNYHSEDFADTVLSLEWRTDKQASQKELLNNNDQHSDEPNTVASQFGDIIVQMAGIQEPVQSTMTYKDVATVLEEKLGLSVELDENDKEKKEVDREIEALMRKLNLDEMNLGREQETHNYDIDDLDELPQWKHGDTIDPDIGNLLERAGNSIEKMVEKEKDTFEKFQLLGEREKINLLIKSNRSFYIKKTVWDHIIKNIHDQEVSNANFAILNFETDKHMVHKLFKALVNNQELLREYVKCPGSDKPSKL